MRYRIAEEQRRACSPWMPVHNQSLRHNGPPDPAGRASNATGRICVWIRPKAGSLSVLLHLVADADRIIHNLCGPIDLDTCDYGLRGSGLPSRPGYRRLFGQLLDRERNHPFLATSRCCGLSLLATDPWTSPAVSYWCRVTSCHAMQLVSLLRR